MHIHLDPIGGVAGDMFIAALLDMRPDLVEDAIAFSKQAVKMGGGLGRIEEHHDEVLTGSRFVVAAPGSSPHTHEGHTHTSWRTIRHAIQASGMPPDVVSHSLEIFGHLANAEAVTHGQPVNDVTFHEVGAWDSITDIVIAAHLLSKLPQATWSICALPTGSGRVTGSHGKLPIPAPATVELLRGFVMHDDGVGGERVTPTGAAILKHIAPSYRPYGTLGRLKRNGRGFGSRKLDQDTPNVLRMLEFERVDTQVVPADTSVAVLEFDVDDQTGEDLSIACDRIRGLDGVLDVLQTPGFGKKGRMVAQVRVLANPQSLEEVATACLNETTTLGVRTTIEARRVLPRAEVVIPTQDRQIPVKVTTRPDGTKTTKAAADAIAETKGGFALRKATRDLVENIAKVPGDLVG